MARRALQTLLSSKQPHPVARHLLLPKTPVYYFVKRKKIGSWIYGYVLRAEEHLVLVCTNSRLEGRPLQVAYEYISLVPSSSLLKQLDLIELGFVDGTELEEKESSKTLSDTTTPLAKESTPSSLTLPDESNMVRTVIHDAIPVLQDLRDGSSDFSFPEFLEDSDAALWAVHPNSTTLLAAGTTKVNVSSMDLGVPTPSENPDKGIGQTSVTAPKSNASLQSTEQILLRQIRDIIGCDPVTESKLQFAPRWILDKAIVKEKANYSYQDAYIPVSIRNVPRNSNIISSHHFF